MQDRGEGSIWLIAVSGPAPSSVMQRRAAYAGSLAFAVAMSQTLSAELEGTKIRVQVLYPGVVATEFHERQGMDLSALRRRGARLRSTSMKRRLLTQEPPRKATVYRHRVCRGGRPAHDVVAINRRRRRPSKHLPHLHAGEAE